jgi:hypothetical protein
MRLSAQGETKMSDTRLGEPLPRTFLDNLVRLATESKPNWEEIWSNQHGIVYAWSNHGEPIAPLWILENNRPDWTSWCIIRTDWEEMLKREAK